MKERLIRNAVNSIKEFGYAKVDENNIFTDKIYSRFFKSMLEENLGFTEEIDKLIEELLKEIN